MKIAFDIDDTLWKIEKVHDCCARKTDATCVGGTKFRQVPDYEIIQVLKWFYNNGDDVYVWSAGGLDYAQTIVDKLGLSEMVTVIPKKAPGADYQGSIDDIDIAFDDQDTELGKVDVRVKRDDISCDCK